jgi:hypothetical protein
MQSVSMLSVIYVVCRKQAYYAECLQAECRSAIINAFFMLGMEIWEPRKLVQRV